MDIVSDLLFACLLTSGPNSISSFLLVRHPQVMEKVRAEIASTVKDDAEISRSDLRSMNYLQNVIKESEIRLCSI